MEFNLFVHLTRNNINKKTELFFQRNKYKVKSDEELLILLKSSNDQKIIGELYLRYGHLVFGVCLNLLKNKPEAEDRTMMIFEELYNKVSKHTVSNFKSWLFTVTKNECYMILRKKNYRFENELPETIVELESQDKELLEQNISHLYDAIKQLKTDQAMAIKLFYIEEMSYKEIASKLDWELNKVKSQVQNAKRNLKIILEEKNVVNYTS